jgi:nucleoside-diphosphate-sugar epimerase
VTRALIIGGTGPTGPHIVNGLEARGYDVTILHTGRHETDLIAHSVEHIHTDPFDPEATSATLHGRTFDIAVVTYGRLRQLAEILVGKVGHFVSIGGVGVYQGFANPDEIFPAGLMVPQPADAALVGDDEFFRKLRRIRETEERVLELHPQAIHLRYPQIYGPRQLLPREWPIVRRVLDRRPFLIVPDGGLTVKAQSWIENAAHAALLAADAPAAALGNIYNVADDSALSIAQIAEIVADEFGHEWELVNLPADVAPSARPMLTSWSSTHRVIDTRPLQRDLGYRDVVDPVDAWRRAARWLAENPLEPGGPAEQRLQDPFDYDAEDALVAAWREARVALEAVTWTVEPGYTAAYVGRKPNPAATPTRLGSVGD